MNNMVDYYILVGSYCGHVDYGVNVKSFVIAVYLTEDEAIKAAEKFHENDEPFQYAMEKFILEDDLTGALNGMTAAEIEEELACCRECNCDEPRVVKCSDLSYSIAHYYGEPIETENICYIT